jgi:HD-like signal output (HDOD) protein/CheY-like chemotaxis protein
VALVILAEELPGYMSGVERLESLHGDVPWPPLILRAHSTLELRNRLANAGPLHLLPAAAKATEVVAATRKLLATSAAAWVGIPLHARKLACQSELLRMWPPSLLTLQAYADHEDAPLADFARDLTADPKLSADLLRLANSTAFGLRRKLTNAHDAIAMLGIRRAISLVVSATVIDVHARIFRKLPESLRAWYQQRYVLLGTIAFDCARGLEGLAPDNAYILGLLQDIGILVLARAYEQRYLDLLEQSRESGQPRLDILEEREFHTTHAEVSAALLQSWHFPPALVSLVLRHHDPERTSEHPQPDRHLLRILQISEAVADLADGGAPRYTRDLSRLLQAASAEREQPSNPVLREAIAKNPETSRLLCLPVPDGAVLHRLLERVAESHSMSEVRPATAEAGQSASFGAAFRPKVPEASASGCIPPHSAPTDRAERPSVLVIDDDEVSTCLLVYFLNSEEIEAVACGTTAEAKALAPQVNAILCDVHLRGESGIDLVRELRGTGFTGPVLMMSSDRTRATVEECIEVGIVDYLIKPFEKAKLVEKLHRHASFLFPAPRSPISRAAPRLV